MGGIADPHVDGVLTGTLKSPLRQPDRKTGAPARRIDDEIGVDRSSRIERHTGHPLRTGVEYTFKVKARWKVGDKTYEYVRSVPVAAGNRSKAIVVAGTEVKE